MGLVFPDQEDFLPFFQTYQQTKTFESLDGIRCLSILAVIFFHSVTSATAFPFLDRILNRGFLGVDMFFVLSGYLIVTLMLREQQKTGTISIPAFYYRRILRIFPAYFLFLTALGAVYLTVSKDSVEAGRFFAALPFNLTFTSNWLPIVGMTGVLWSLATEEQFYMIWPMVQKWLKPRPLVVLLLVVIAVNQLFNFRVFGEQHDSLKILQATFTPIALGALLANVLHRPRGFDFLFRWIGFPGASLFWMLVCLILMGLPAEDISGWQRLSIQLSMTAFLAPAVARQDHWLRPVLAFLPIRRIGQISYGMYLYHLVALSICSILLRKIGVENSLLGFAATLLMTVAAAEVSFRVWESPFLKLKDRLVRVRRP